MSPWLELEWNGLQRSGFCGKALWSFCYKFTFVAAATSITLLSFCMTVVLGTKPVSRCHHVLLSPRNMNLTNFCMIPVLLVHVCAHAHRASGTN